MIRAIFPVLLGILFSLPDRASAVETTAGQSSPAHPLDQKRIHETYTEGDFEAVIAAIDSFTLVNKVYSHSDSVFIAKHLAVIYTANPKTREKGKNHMFRLLSLLPSAKIVDMFVSDEIDHIFEKVREEYVVRQEILGQKAPSKLESNRYAADKLKMNGPPGTAPHSEPEAKRKKGFSHPYYWVAGGVAAAVLGGTAIYLLQPGKTADKVYDLPE